MLIVFRARINFVAFAYQECCAMQLLNEDSAYQRIRMRMVQFTVFINNKQLRLTSEKNQNLYHYGNTKTLGPLLT